MISGKLALVMAKVTTANHCGQNTVNKNNLYPVCKYTSYCNIKVADGKLCSFPCLYHSVYENECKPVLVWWGPGALHGLSVYFEGPATCVELAIPSKVL